MDATVGLVIAGAALAVFVLLGRLGKIPAARARELVKQGASLLDVRSRGEFQSGHLPGARNVPVQELATRLAEVGPRDKPVVVYCASGMRSARAASMLRSAGFAAVHDLGGMSRW